MNWKIGLLFLLLPLSIKLYGQKQEVARVDSISYQMYLEQDWETLYQYGKSAIKEDNGFYYLYVRTALAAFYTQNYHHAVKWFKKADALQGGNDFINEIYYLAALYAGLPLETEKRYKALNIAIKEKYKPLLNKQITYAGVRVGVAQNTDFNQLDNSELENVNGVYGNRVMLKDFSFRDLDFGQRINSHFSMDYHLENLTLHKQHDIYTFNALDNNFERLTESHKTSQWLYNAVGHYNVNDKIYFSLGLSYIHFNTSYTKDLYDDATGLYDFEYTEMKDNIKHLSFSTLWKSTYWSSSLSLGLTQTPAMLNYQVGLANTYKPFQSKGLYATFSFFLKTNENKSDDDMVWEPIYKVDLAYQIKKAWLRLSYSTGNHRNYTDGNGALVYNTAEDIQARKSVSLSLPLYKHNLWLNLLYSNMKYESNYSYLDESYNLRKENYLFTTQSISGGLIWYF